MRFDIIHPIVHDFADSYTYESNSLLAEIAEFTNAQNIEQHMLSGKVQGKFLQMVSWMIRPKRILEIGTFTGYSALCLADGLADDGLLYTIELREETAAIANNFFSKSALHSRIKLLQGDAKSLISELHETWDLVFIDADKPAYIDYFKMVLPKVRKNGFILADNIFFHGAALQEEPKGKSAKGIKAFNDFIGERTDIDKLVLTIRDGLYLLRKL